MNNGGRVRIPLYSIDGRVAELGYTRLTQNQVGLARVGSIPTSATRKIGCKFHQDRVPW